VDPEVGRLEKPRASDSASQRIHWHPAFFQAIQLELADYRDLLEFKYEYQLTAEPLRVDTLIIVKPPSVRIDKNIARIFRTVNLCEYKSPEDYLSVKDFFKVYAYASLYAAITPETDMSELTLTFVGSRYPRELIQYLTGERHYRVEEGESGIYQVRGDYLPIQIIESKRLSPSDNRWLKTLTKDLEREEVKGILKEGKNRGKGAPMDAYFDAVLRANSKTFKEVLKMSDDTLTLEDVLMEAGLIPKWLAQGREEGEKKGREEKAVTIALNLLKKGWTAEETAETAELDIEKVRALYASAGKPDGAK
jgi:hypothetical protein